MVRFSEILGSGRKRAEKQPSQKKEVRTGGKLWMSDSQILATKGTDTSFNLPPLDHDADKTGKLYGQLFEKATEVRDRVKKDEGITPSPILSLLHSIIEEDTVDELYDYVLTVPGGSGWRWHSIAVTLGSLKLGKGLGFDTKKLLKLGLAAFLENVGMYKIPEHVLDKKGILSPDEVAAIREHPDVSAQILGRMGRAYDWLAKVAAQIHERSDGSGYPMGLKGEEISPLASVIGLVDTYMAMIKNRPYRNKYMQTEAVKSLIELGKGKFPSRVVKEFLNQISLFPVNTYVRLNNKSIGRVISTNKNQPLRPKIEILYDGLGREMEKPKTIQLSDSPLLHIVDTINEDDLPHE